MCNDDKYAMNISLDEDNMLRLDIAGEKLLLNAGPAIRTTEHILSSSKRLCNSFVETIRSKLSSSLR